MSFLYIALVFILLSCMLVKANHAECSSEQTAESEASLAEAVITVFVGSGGDTASSLYWGTKAPIWNNRGDTAYLRNASGELVYIYTYPGAAAR
jgi:hypothetical protein